MRLAPHPTPCHMPAVAAGALLAVANSHVARPSFRQGPVPGDIRDAPRRLNRTIERISPHGDARFTLRQLLEAGVHFGHHTRRWNPRMAPYIFGVRNQVHILDLQQTVPMMDRALRAVRDVVAAGGRVLFVGTKRAAAEYVAECRQALRPVLRQPPLARRHADQLEDHHRLDQAPGADRGALGGNIAGLTKKEILMLTREKEKLDRALGGIKEMGGLPDIIFVIDMVKEKLAIEEANKLGIPVVAVVDSNADPAGRRPSRSRATMTRSAPSPLLRHGRRRGAGRHLGRDAGPRRRYRRAPRNCRPRTSLPRT